MLAGQSCCPGSFQSDTWQEIGTGVAFKRSNGRILISFSSMRSRFRTIRAVLTVLVLVIGPLQAQSVFACSMMNEVMHGECCCVGHKTDQDCVDADCKGAPQSVASPCCERSVQFTFDEEARADTPIIKSIEVRSDVDPPQYLIASSSLAPPSLTVVIRSVQTSPREFHSRSDTYFITQRLRI